jgi:hypothetical protein
MSERHPTPWTAYSGEDTNDWFVIHDADGHEIGSTDGGFEEEEAKIFAAAPDLLAACKFLINVTETAPPIKLIAMLDEAIQKIKEAVAKAE